jgi:hypothetical protein
MAHLWVYEGGTIRERFSGAVLMVSGFALIVLFG